VTLTNTFAPGQAEIRIPQSGIFSIRIPKSAIRNQLPRTPNIERSIQNLLPLSFNLDKLVKSPFSHFSVIPADPVSSPGGIQSRRGGIQGVLDAGSSPA
jgi:hypothetical protein